MKPAIDRLTRRVFLRTAGGTALAVGAGSALAACGGGGNSGGSATKELSFVYMGTAEQHVVEIAAWLGWHRDPHPPAFAKPAARGFNRGAIYRRDGTLVASVAQEGLIRPR